MRTHFWFALLCLALAGATGCAPYPRDPEHTTARVTGSVMRVGVIHDPPLVDLRAGVPRGREIEMVRALAESLGARVEWVEGGTYELFEDLQHFRLDLLVGGIPPQTPWKPHVALTSPYAVGDEHGWLRQRVTALPPGENRWLMQVERFQRSAQARATLGGAPLGGPTLGGATKPAAQPAPDDTAAAITP